MTGIAAGLGQSIKTQTADAVDEAVSDARAKLAGTAPSLAFVTATVDHDAQRVHREVRERLPGVAIHGVTTSLGVLGSEGVVMGAQGVVGVLLLGADEGVSFAVGSAEIGEDPGAAGEAAARALRSALGEAHPAVMLFNASPGHEERVLRGIASELPNVPAYGGSAADHTIAGEWSVFTNDGVASNAVSLAGIAGKVKIGAAFIAPYQAVGETGEVTQSAGRQLQTIDGRPAAQVLGEWVGPEIDEEVQRGGNILAQTALNPLGLRLGGASTERYITLHPAQIDAKDASVGLFAEAPTGATLCRMRSTADKLVASISQLFNEALADGELKVADVKAAVLIYCAGCAGSLGARLHDGLREHLGGELASIPLLGLCTFGEQGFVPGVGNVHSNLSLSLVLIADG